MKTKAKKPTMLQQLRASITEQEYRELKAEANLSGLSLADYLAAMIRERLKKKDRRAP